MLQLREQLTLASEQTGRQAGPSIVLSLSLRVALYLC